MRSIIYSIVGKTRDVNTSIPFLKFKIKGTHEGNNWHYWLKHEVSNKLFEYM